MSALIDISPYQPAYSPSLAKYFSDMIAENSAIFMEVMLTREINAYLKAVTELAKTVMVVADNPIPVSQESIDKTRKCLRFMQEVLSGEKDLGCIAEQKETLENIYLDIAEAVSKIVIQNSIFGFGAIE